MIYAIAEIGGKQFKLSKAQRLCTPKLMEGVDATFECNKVLLYHEDAGQIAVGAPFLDNVIVKARVLAHAKSDKVIVFKKKRRNGYKVKRGHRQDYTKILIEDIIINK